MVSDEGVRVSTSPPIVGSGELDTDHGLLTKIGTLGTIRPVDVPVSVRLKERP